MATIARLYKDAELDISGEINERLPKICDFTKINIQSVSNGKGTPYIKINDVTKINPPRSWTILRLDPFGEFVDSNGYDVFGNSSLAQNAIDLINNTPNGYTICIATFDEPLTNSINLRNLLSTFGFNILNYNWVYRCAWLGVFQKGANSILSEKYIYSGIVNDEILIPKVVNFPMDGTTKSIQGIDCIHDNCNLTNNGIYVEEGTTNLITELSGIHGYPSKILGVLQLDGFYKFDISADNNEILQDLFRAATPSTTYTESFLFKTDSTNVSDGIFHITFYTTKHNLIPIKIQKLGYNLYKASASYTTLSTETQIRAFDIMNIKYLNGTYISIRDAQLEEKPYATSYTSGTRPNSNNGVQIPTSYFQFPFSVTMDVIPDIKDGSNSVYGAEPSIMYIANLWKNSGFVGSIDQRFRNSIINGLENGFKYTLVYRNTGYDVYMNNIKVVNNVGYYSGAFNLSDIPMFTVGCRGDLPDQGYANARYKNIAFYNKELTQNDVNKLCNNKFSITKEGNINSFELIEDQNPNLLLDSSFPVNTTKWNIRTSNGISIDTTVKYLNNNSVKMVNSGTNRLDIPVQYYSPYTTNQIMTLSVYIMSPDVSQITSNMDCWIGFRNSSGTANGNISRQITPANFAKIGNNNWFKWIIQGSNIDTTNIYCTFMCATNNTTATVYVSSPKLKLGNTDKMSIQQNQLYLNEITEGGIL